jgi:Protein of unknown function (DUF1419)
MLGDFVLAKTSDHMSIWDFYQTLDEAAQAAPVINAKEGGGYLPMTYERYKVLEKEFWLKDGIQRITAAKFDQMLNVLPPMRWRQEGALNSFLMSERMSGTFTYQYAQLGFGPDAAYFEKMVDLSDPSTFMTEASLRTQFQK